MANLSKEKKNPQDSEKNQMCGECGLKFSTKSNLNRHVRTVHSNNAESGNGDFCCDRCGHLYSRKDNLNHHIKNVHDTSDQVIKCHVCSKICASHDSLRHHIKTVHKADSSIPVFNNINHQYNKKKGVVICDKCKVHVTSKTALQRHVCDVQTGVKRKPDQVSNNANKKVQ